MFLAARRVFYQRLHRLGAKQTEQISEEGQSINFRGADLARCDLASGTLGGVDLSLADLRGADLTDADLRGANLDTTHHSCLSIGRRYVENEGQLNERIWIKSTIQDSYNSDGQKMANGWIREFPFWGEATIRRMFNNAIEDSLVVSSSEFNQRPMDRTLWYTIDYDRLGLVNGPVDRVAKKMGQKIEASLTALESRKVAPFDQDDQMVISPFDQNDQMGVPFDQDDQMTSDHLDQMLSTENGPHENKRKNNHKSNDGKSVSSRTDSVPDIGLCANDLETTEGDAICVDNGREEIIIEGANLDKSLLNGDKGEVWGQIQSAFDTLGQWRNFTHIKSSPLYGLTGSPLDNSQAVRCEGDTLVVAVHKPNAASALQQGRLGLTLAQIVTEIKPGLKLSFEQSLQNV